MEQSPNAPQEKEQKQDRRSALNRHVGRRTSDWVMPILFWVLGLSALLSAVHFYRRATELESLYATQKEQVRLLEKKIRLLEKSK
jgi:hypothetical protein